ncbi:hypothetical protein 65p192 [Aeromonas phage 65]|uniref:Uncharacterized protein n=2 Tax=Ishigurovirus osborne TaxID=260149 RepID=A0A219YC46_9CAUD|nr:hypothetical protein ST65p192 [Aeromonas phage 65]ADQ53200.1 hypothetical protein 65p192 [Aeromonas phage 65]APU01576.1 hypothetical protein [Aeromonas phage 65.2]
MDFDNVDEFYSQEYQKGIGHYRKCKDALKNLKDLFPNIKWVYAFTHNYELENPSPTVVDETIDICSRDYIIVTEQGKVIALGTSEWGHLEETDADNFEVV